MSEAPERQYHCDVEYVRADIAAAEIERLQEQVAKLRDVLERAEYALGNHIKPHSWRDDDGLIVWAEQWVPDARDALARHTSNADSG